ncbi:MAG: hypothetical protein KDK65_05885 [Chlamydiia bacterium]|nr:hypothetical protein [Chlamydiia bacterium]
MYALNPNHPDPAGNYFKKGALGLTVCTVALATLVGTVALGVLVSPPLGVGIAFSFTLFSWAWLNDPSHTRVIFTSVVLTALAILCLVASIKNPLALLPATMCSFLALFGFTVAYAQAVVLTSIRIYQVTVNHWNL